MDPCCSGKNVSDQNLISSMTMDPEYSLQDVVRCGLCKTHVPPMYCDICELNLCKPCVGEHLSDESTEHNVVPFKKRGSTIYCSKHSTKRCCLYCEHCKVPICVQCVSSGEHIGHKQSDVKFLENKNENLQKDLKELEVSIYPKYQKIASNILVWKVDLRENSNKLKTALGEHGENLHREIDNAIKTLKADVDEKESKDLVHLDKQRDEIERKISEITRIIADLKKLLKSNDERLVSSYKYSIAQFKGSPSKPKVALQRLSPQKINKQQIDQLFQFDLIDLQRNPKNALEQFKIGSQEDGNQQYICPVCRRTSFPDRELLLTHLQICLDLNMP